MYASLKKAVAITLASLVFTTAVNAEPERDRPQHQYKITITNITKHQSFTPFIVASHKPAVHFFSLGEPASEAIANIAEGGDTSLLAEQLSNSRGVSDIAKSEGLLAAGSSVEITIAAAAGVRTLSLAAMLLPTNDTFVALDAVALPTQRAQTYLAYAYDAGSETNSETCATIPGPLCGGIPFSPEDSGEGFVHVAAGISGSGDIDAAQYDWRGPVAKVVIERL
ncbi:spondin domain-containing protein [Teredinibacter turnerae]|uniref:spondin domain-containing protein n=1 Tax=Teredinibacter turnerae TaxID=2426 RepID=UPI0004090F65|nr:spondin domain-containing protein [Teredinibacter turnerae]